MSLVIRTWNLIFGLMSRLLSFFERRNPEALLEKEKENLRKLIARYNDGLISHAALSERLMTQVRRGEREMEELAARVQAHLNASNRKAAARHALQRKQVTSRLGEDRKQLEEAERTYSELVRTRDMAVAEAKDKIEQLRREIGDLKVKRAIADLEGMAAAMVSDLGGTGDSFNRLQEMVSEEREKAAARARVAGDGLDAEDLAAKEAEQDALAEQALQDFLSSEPEDEPELPPALPDLTKSWASRSMSRPRGNEEDC